MESSLIIILDYFNDATKKISGNSIIDFKYQEKSCKLINFMKAQRFLGVFYKLLILFDIKDLCHTYLK